MKKMDQWLWWWSIPVHGDPVSEHGGGFPYQRLCGKGEWDLEGSVDGCLCRHPVGEPGEGVRLQGTVRDSGKRAPEMEHLFLWELC